MRLPGDVSRCLLQNQRQKERRTVYMLVGAGGGREAEVIMRWWRTITV
jgi:hypothetical protein